MSAIVIAVKSPDSSWPEARRPQHDANIKTVSASFLLFNLSLVIKVVLQNQQCPYRYSDDRTVRKSEQVTVVSPHVRGNDCLNYLDCATGEVVAQEMY